MVRLYEFVKLKENASVAATCSGSIASVSTPLGAVQRRMPPGNLFTGKYTTDSDLTPNTPDWMKKLKRKK